MIYYKIIQGGSIVAALTENELRKHQEDHNTLSTASPDEAEYIQSYDMTLYHDNWMQPVKSKFHTFLDATISAVTYEEYLPLFEAFSKSELAGEPEYLPMILPADVYDGVEEDEGENLSNIDFVRAAKLKELSAACARAIMDGFDAELYGEKHHFSLTMQDQTNLVSAQLQLLKGDLLIAYHADGEEVKYYTPAEMNTIIDAANAHKTYNLVYHNALKLWVNSLKRISTISKITYGDEIPKKYRSDLLDKLQSEAES